MNDDLIAYLSIMTQIMFGFAGIGGMIYGFTVKTVREIFTALNVSAASGLLYGLSLAFSS